MFRTLQNQPSVILIFHNQKLKASQALYQVVEKLTSKAPLADKVYLDLVTNKMPTYDQFSTIVSNVPTDDSYGQRVLRQAFPLLSDKHSEKGTTHTTIKGAPQMFNEGEYNIIRDTFDKIENGAASEVSDPEELFTAPLVVDWDRATIANDEEGLKKMLSLYEKEEAAK